MMLDTFFNNFELVTQAPNGIAKLRDLILQSAVQGQLVNQDPKDCPAIKLLEQLRIERDCLGQSRTQRSDRTLPDRIEMPFKIPDGWCWTYFDDIKMYAFTGLERPKQLQSDDNRYAYLKMNNITLDGRCDLGSFTRVNASNEEALKFKLSDGDFLFNTRNSYELVGKTCVFPASTGESFLFNNNILKVRFGASINPHFINLWFVSPVARATLNTLKSSTTNVAAIYQGKLSTFPIPIPPVEEQKRIVAKVDKLMRLCTELEERQQRRRESRVRVNHATLTPLKNAASLAAEELELAIGRLANNFATLYDSAETVGQLRLTILQLAVQGKLVRQDPDDESALILLERMKAETKKRSTEILAENGRLSVPLDSREAPFELPHGWMWARFIELGELSRGRSKHRPRNAPELYIDGKYKFVQTGDVARANGVIKTFTALYNDKGLAQSRMWPKGTMCITIAANIADSGILGFDACFPDSVVGFIPSKIIGSANYFEYFMRTAKSHLQDFAPSTAQKNINLAILESVLIPLPPLAEQKRIVAKVKELMDLCDELEGKLRQSEAERVKLMNAAVQHVLKAVTEVHTSNVPP